MSKHRSKRTGFVTVSEYVDIEVGIVEHLDSVDTKDLLAELSRRREKGEVIGDDAGLDDNHLDELERAVRDGDMMHFSVIMARLRKTAKVSE